MAPMKRQAKSPMKSAKKAKVDEVGPKIKELAEVLSNPACDVPGPSGNRAMLLGALPHALADYSDERHGYQTTVSKLIGEVMNGWVAKWEQKVADSKANVDAAESDRIAAQATHETEKSGLVAQKEDVKLCKENLKAATDAEKEAAGKLATAKSDVENFDKEIQKQIITKDNISMVYNQSFLVMKSAEAPSGSEAKNHLKKIAPILKSISTETSLQIALPAALQKKAAERGQFDNMAVDGVEAVFTGTIAKLTGEIDSAGVTKAGKEAAATEATTAHDAAEAKRQECIAALKASQSSQEEKEKSLVAAEKAEDSKAKAANRALKDNAQEQRGLDHAKSTLAYFQFLVDRTTPPPPLEEAPVEAVAAAV